MDYGDYHWGLYRDQYRDPWPHSLLSTRETSRPPLAHFHPPSIRALASLRGSWVYQEPPSAPWGFGGLGLSVYQDPQVPLIEPFSPLIVGI